MDSSDDDESGKPAIDWELLASTCSPAALEALKLTLANKEAEPSGATANDLSSGASATDASSTRHTINKSFPSPLLSATQQSRKIAVNNTAFGKMEYWDERFEEEDEYDWLVTFKSVEKELVRILSPENKILIVGCGNSTFSADLYDAGFHNLVNIDYSKKVIDRMSAKHSTERPLMQWTEMNMLYLDAYPDEFFDVVLDKAAMDALMVDEGDVWYPAQSVVDSADQMCCEINRVTKKDTGVFVQISFAQPHFRSKYLMGYRKMEQECSPYESHKGYNERYNWWLTHKPIHVEGGCLNSFLYTATRSEQLKPL